MGSQFAGPQSWGTSPGTTPRSVFGRIGTGDPSIQSLNVCGAGMCRASGKFSVVSGS